MEEHPSLILKQQKKLKIQEVADVSASALSVVEQLKQEIQKLERKHKELRETNLQVATVQSLQSSIDKMTGLFTKYIAKEEQVQDKELEILKDISRVLNG